MGGGEHAWTYTRMTQSYPPMRIIGRFFIDVKFIIPVILKKLKDMTEQNRKTALHKGTSQKITTATVGVC